MKKICLLALFSFSTLGLFAQSNIYSHNLSFLMNVNEKPFETMLPDSAITVEEGYGEIVTYKSLFDRDSNGNYVTKIEERYGTGCIENFDKKGRRTYYEGDGYWPSGAVTLKYGTNQIEEICYYYGSTDKSIITFDDKGYFKSSFDEYYEEIYTYTVEDDGTVTYLIHAKEIDEDDYALSYQMTVKYNDERNPVSVEMIYLREEYATNWGPAKMTFTYNSDRKVTSYEMTNIRDGRNEKETGKYEYDSQGNITLKEESRDTYEYQLELTNIKWNKRTVYYYDTESSIKSTPQSNISTYYDAASQSLFIKGLENTASVSVYSIDGNLLLTKEIIGNESVAMDKYQSGVYIVTVKTMGESVSQKVIKK